MIIAGLWRYGDLRHVATGCNALVSTNSLNVGPIFSGAVLSHQPYRLLRVYGTCTIIGPGCQKYDDPIEIEPRV